MAAAESLGAEPGFQFVRDSRGNFFGSSYAGGQVLKWNAEGQLVAVAGRSGDGPGELGRGQVSVFTAEDSVYVRDSHQHWVVLDSALRLVREADLGPIVAFGRYDTHFIPGNGVLSTNQRQELAGAGIALMTRDGRVIRHFGQVEDTAGPWQPRSRASVYAGGGLIWVAPVAGPRAGYRLEIWDTTGQIRDSILRTPDWFPAQPDYTADYFESSSGRPFPFPSISLVFADTLGVVWVVSTLPRGPGAEKRFREAPIRELANVRANVLEYNIDAYSADTRQLLAATRIPADPALFADPVYDGRQVIRFREDSAGNRQVLVAELALAGITGGECTVP